MSGLALALRHWPVLVGGAIATLLLALLAIRTGERDDARAALDRARGEHAVFAERVRAEAGEAARRFAENARRVERAQDRATQEASHDYQQRISDLHRRLAALQLRRREAGAHPGGAGGAGLPRLSGAAGGPDAAAGACRLPFPDAVIATEQAIRLEELQRWVRRQQAVERATDAAALARAGSVLAR